MKRTYLIRLGAPALAAALYCAVSIGSRPGPLRPVGVQMHVHGSMSEGGGSMRGANVQARKVGLEVIWWSEHDWRMAYHTYNKGFDFESEELEAVAPRAADGGEMRIQLAEHGGNGAVREQIARTTTARAAQGQRSLEIAAAPAKSGFQHYFYEIDSTRRTMKRSLASKVNIEVSVWPEKVDRDSFTGLRVDLSQQPPDMKPGAIFYVCTAMSEGDLRALENEHVKYVKVDCKPGQWNRIQRDLTADARRLNLGGEDNSMVAMSFGVSSRGPLARAFFDDYRIRHELESEPLRAEARRMAAALQKEYGVINYIGQEFSYQAHMNPLGLKVPMIDYVQNPRGLGPAETTEFTHRNGGIISLNHIFGTSRPPKGVNPKDPVSARQFEDRRIQELVSTRCYGADILEVGYPVRVLPMKSFLRVWDALLKAGIDVVGNGVSDSHTSTGGWTGGNNFVSWVWAPSPSQEDIIDGFRRGEVFFGDPAQFKGKLNLSTGDGHRMGQVVVTAKPRHAVKVAIDGLAGGAKIRTVTGGDYGEEFTATGPAFERTVPVETGKATYFRVEVYMADGRPLVFSNPIFFRTDEGKISAFKRAVCR